MPSTSGWWQRCRHLLYGASSGSFFAAVWTRRARRHKCCSSSAFRASSFPGDSEGSEERAESTNELNFSSLPCINERLRHACCFGEFARTHQRLIEYFVRDTSREYPLQNRLMRAIARCSFDTSMHLIPGHTQVDIRHETVAAVISIEKPK